MDVQAISIRIEALLQSLASGRRAKAPDSDGSAAPLELPQALEELERAVKKLMAERDALAAREKEVLELLRCESSDRLIHDLRTVINNLELLKILLEKSRAKAGTAPA